MANKLERIAAPVLVAATMLSCGAPRARTNPLPVKEGVVSWSGESRDYDVDVKVFMDKNEHCVYRVITLREKVGLHINYAVGYVRAEDDRCDDTIDNWQFRDPRDAPNQRLEEDVLFAFYSTMPLDGRRY